MRWRPEHAKNDIRPGCVHRKAGLLSLSDCAVERVRVLIFGQDVARFDGLEDM